MHLTTRVGALLLFALVAIGSVAKSAPVEADALSVAMDRRDAGQIALLLAKAERAGADATQLRVARAQLSVLRGNPEAALATLSEGAHAPADAIRAWRVEAAARAAMGDPIAMEQYKKAIELAPEDPIGWLDLARYHLRNGVPGRAMEAADRALTLAPENPDALTLRALLVRDQYGLRASVPWFERALASDPRHVPALVELAATLTELGQTKAGLGVARRALAVSPGNARAFFVLAVIAARADNPMLARSMLARTKGQLADVPAAMLLDGILAIRTGNPSLAVEPLALLVERQPLNGRARKLLARALVEAGRGEESVAALLPILNRNDVDTYALSIAAKAYSLYERFDEAERAALMAGNASSNPNPEFWNEDFIRNEDMRAIKSRMSSGDVAGAIASAKALARQHPGAPDAKLALGDVLLMANDLAGAKMAYEQAANLRFSAPVALRLIDTLQRMGDAEGAARVMTLHFNENPQNVDLLRLTAQASLRAEQFDVAMSRLDAIGRLIGYGDPMLLADLSAAHLGAGNPEKALRYAARAYRLQPISAAAMDAYALALMAQRNDPQAAHAAVDLLEKAFAIRPDLPVLAQHLGDAYRLAGNLNAARLAYRSAALSPDPALRRAAAQALAQL